MLRLLILLILLFLLYKIVRNLLASGKEDGQTRRRDRRSTINELVQDPVCHTYIPLRDSEKRTIMGKAYFFCSKECADKFEEGLRV